MNLTKTQRLLIEAIIYHGTIELASHLLHKSKKTTEAHLHNARKNNGGVSTMHLCFAYLLHYPETPIPKSLSPHPALPQPIEIIKTDYSKAIITVNDDFSDMDDIIQFTDLRAIYDAPKE
jgi:hypothetical protein